MGRRIAAFIGIIVLVSAAEAWAQQPGAGARRPEGAPGETSRGAPELKTDKEKSSYLIGYNVGTQVGRQFGPTGIELRLLIVGLGDGLMRKPPALAAQEMQQAIQRYLADLNKTKGDQFLAANKGKQGVVTLPSGLQYVVLKEGTGKRPRATDSVTVHYHGTLLDGSVFDSSVRRGQPFSTALNGIIPGWIEVLQLMNEGAKWRVFLPPILAYGATGSGAIGPNETLVFEIELLKIN